jgi:hypothetical protein
VIPASALDRGPRPESTASAPPTADSSAAGSAASRSAVTVRTSLDSFFGFRTTAVTSWPASTACSRSCRLQHAGWIARERDPTDRRAVLIRALHDRNPELFHLYAGMNSSMDQLCATYTDNQLQLIADFLRRTTNAGRDATDELASD